jgi:glycine/D-amino acid oxidase-like deaminating enzyme
MISASYDAIVLGVGAMGSATVYQLARRGSGCSGWIATTSRTRWGPHTGTPASSAWPTTRTPPT